MAPQKPKLRSFEARELAFFWNPRAWPDIVARFGTDMPGSSDIRDAIIVVDDEGGIGFLRWHANLGSWCLTDKGKTWVRNMVGPRILVKERDWKPAEDVAALAAAAVAQNAIADEATAPAIAAVPEEEKPAETREQALARLIAEQAEDR